MKNKEYQAMWQARKETAFSKHVKYAEEEFFKLYELTKEQEKMMKTYEICRAISEGVKMFPIITLSEINPEAPAVAAITKKDYLKWVEPHEDELELWAKQMKELTDKEDPELCELIGINTFLKWIR